MASVELKGLSRHYGNAVAVDGVSLRVEHGQLVCLLGPSGCGKTTTLRLIAGFIEPSAGEIEVGGKLLSSPSRTVPPEGRNMSMIFQSYALWPHMTVAENVAYGLKIRKLDRTTIDAKLKAILGTARLEALADRYPGELSGGQQQRVSLARALVVEPETLLLDEPLSNLDANLREEMRFEIRRLHDEFRMTTVYVTHDQAEAMATSDRIAVMHGGRIEQVDAPHLLYTRPRTRFVAGFIGRTNLLDATWSGEEIGFEGGFGLPAGLLGLAPPDGVRQGTISIRPQGMRLHRSAPVAGVPSLPATIAARVFLGETWDYGVALPGTEHKLRVAAPPFDVFDVGAPVWIEFDPRQMAVVR